LWLLEHTNDLDTARSNALDLHTLKVVSEAYHKRVLARYPSLSELSQAVMDNVCRACLTVEMDQTIQPRQNVDDRISAYTTAMAKRVLMHYKQLEQENNTNLDAYRGDRYRTKYLQVITRPQDKRIFQAIQECNALANKLQYLRVGQACYATNESLMHLRKRTLPQFSSCTRIPDSAKVQQTSAAYESTQGALQHVQVSQILYTR
jgi:ribosomal protein L16 Arg81 hydroxylase